MATAEKRTNTSHKMPHAHDMSAILGEDFSSYPTIQIEAGQTLIAQGTVTTTCYILVSGQIAAQIEDTQLERQAVLPWRYTTGDILAARELFSGKKLSLNLIALEDTHAFVLDREALLGLITQNAQVAEQVILNLTQPQELMQQPLIDSAMANSPIKEVDFMISKAKQAYLDIQPLLESRIDEAIEALAQVIADDAEIYAKETVAESGMGVAEHKIEKIKLGTLAVAHDLIGKPGVGSIIEEHDGIKGIAQSMGIVFAMIPVTNPVETLVFKSLIALKSRNAVIISSHRRAKNVGLKAVKAMQAKLKELGLPVDLIQTSQMPSSRELTQGFMKHPDLNFILATGGPSMVASAYQSGTPAIGVGKGNAPVWIEESCDVEKAAKDVVFSKSFDNGVVCGSENNLLVDDAIYDQFVGYAIDAGAAVLNHFELHAIMESLFAHGSLNRDYIGKSAQEVCDGLGIKRDYPIKLIIAEMSIVDSDDSIQHPLMKEKLLPLVSLTRILDQEQALRTAAGILNNEGAGHTAVMHSNSEEAIQEYARIVDVSRILINTPATLGCIGANNNLQLSWTLGCGTQGCGSTSDNVSYRHLLNIKRIAYPLPADQQS
ncbi:aldehyde dehydrogenase family protein [Bermanella marisrubri]|uniref:Iron-dependent alcohol dehydrogenase of the multifunctional alcohol dehydrogenase AdhE n=1 Tax=Bermanella marisrubri TaxID=207949 RepID=Q1N5I0_9GAMM|nr:aldehyde dehydrogenase family protein [Bermanella marisrubri]EAT13962.1 iron-dependent alcohol dehydrogenase of the multifunctional alcohol dehydrogenase AdhE [Oceanobacter sp. RED65] [Bermanella marisrubri]QIZ84712.1 aldehyde dehydrogenase family protein [Bermanella marisrubri]